MRIRNKKPPFRRRRLGRRLKAMRDAASLNLEQAAEGLDMSRTALHRVETGENKINVHLVRSMMDLYDKYEPDLLNTVRAVNKPPWFSAYGVENMGYVDVETEACQVQEYACSYVPGLLQTEAYIRAMLGHARRKRTRQQIDNDVKVRLIRQKRLTANEDPLELLAIVDEGALHRQVGGPKVMRAQLEHLITMADQPTVTLQLIPVEAGAHSAMDGGFTLLDFSEPDFDTLLYHAYVTGSLHIEDQDEVREAKLVFDALRGEALAPPESVARLATLL